MSTPLTPLSPVLRSVITDSPEPKSAEFFESPSRQHSRHLSSGESTLNGDESPPQRLRFRSATVALDGAAWSFDRYRRGRDRKGKGA